MSYTKNIDFIKKENIRKSKSLNRTLVKNTGITAENAIIGKVIEIKPKVYTVQYKNSANEINKVDCFLAGAIISPHKSATLVACGDEVKFVLSESGDSSELSGAIIEVIKRKSKLSRIDPANKNREHVIASNIDYVLIFSSVLDPSINFRLIDRILVAAMLGDLQPAICINKIDLVEFDDINDIFDIYRNLHIPIFPISIFDGSGLPELFEFLKDKDIVFAGASGVGKSSLLNKIFGREIQKVLEVSESSGKGRHTTSLVSRFELKSGGFITDTPGIREYGLWDIAKDELCLFFPDFNEFFHKCKFPSCTHTHEPDCKVKEAVEKSLISKERYDSYLQIFDSLEK